MFRNNKVIRLALVLMFSGVLAASSFAYTQRKSKLVWCFNAAAGTHNQFFWLPIIPDALDPFCAFGGSARMNEAGGAGVSAGLAALPLGYRVIPPVAGVWAAVVA
ncbi:MAG: hypothetical protein HYR55_09955 [Acidobacteria bacterium]|nr:hypothetical protein [Acidobacteriota bacterium]MBI3658768.1 hypothetical protein [Acidobacteriota bacterium]